MSDKGHNLIPLPVGGEPAKLKRPTGRPKGSGARPTIYDEVVAKGICRRIANGETLVGICREVDLPTEYTVRSWLLDDDGEADVPSRGFSKMYDRARSMHIEHEMDDLLEFAREREVGQVIRRKQTINPKTGQKVVLEEREIKGATDAQRLEIDARKWRIAKIGWRVYGVKAPVQEVTEGAPGAAGNTTTVVVEGGLPKDFSESSAAPSSNLDLDEDPDASDGDATP